MGAYRSFRIIQNNSLPHFSHRCAFESLRQTKHLMSQIKHSYLKLEMALFSFLTNVEFSLLLSLPLPAKVGQTLKPSRGLAEGSVFVQGILFAAYPSPPSTLTLPTRLLTGASCLCRLCSTATKPSVFLANGGPSRRSEGGRRRRPRYSLLWLLPAGSPLREAASSQLSPSRFP